MSEHGNISALLALPDRFADLDIWVVGDLMLDEYVTGTVERISPEAPVPVVCAQATEHRLGGAANVARQVATLGARVSLAGICGADAAGDELLQLCAQAGIDARAVLKLQGRHTTRKLRVVSHSQQLLRLDWEDIQPCAADLTQRLLEKLACGAPPDAIILSDYAKGVLSADMLEKIHDGRELAPVREAIGMQGHEYTGGYAEETDPSPPENIGPCGGCGAGRQCIDHLAEQPGLDQEHRCQCEVGRTQGGGQPLFRTEQPENAQIDLE